MALIVAARFETFDAAQGAAARLLNEGVASDDLHTFFVNPAGSHDRYPLGGDRAEDPDSAGAATGVVALAAMLGVLGAVAGAIIAFFFQASSAAVIAGGAGVGAYIGSLAGAVRGLGRNRQGRNYSEIKARAPAARSSGVVLAVHTQPENEKHIAAILLDQGGVEVERAQGRWKDGKWEDFDPLAAPELEKNF